LKPKVFCIGCHKAGTTTLHAFALAHGYTSLHGVTWSKPDVPLLGTHDFFSDGGGHFWSDRCDEDESYWGDFHNLTYLHSYYPGSRFILQTRPLASWLVSKCLHAGWTDETVIEPDDRTKLVHDDWCYKSRLTIKEWIKARNRYHAKALAFFEKRDKGNLCIVDVCTDTQSAAAVLKAFLRLPDPVTLGHENAAGVRQSRALASRIVAEILAELGEQPGRLI
jgi:hypothetical protein